MVTVEELLFRQGQLETEVLCLQDAVQRLTHRILVLESFIKQKHGELSLDETILFPEEDKDLIHDGHDHENPPENFSSGDFSEFFVPEGAAILGASGQQFILTTEASGKEDDIEEDHIHRIHIQDHEYHDAQNVPNVKIGLEHDLGHGEGLEGVEEQDEEEGMEDVPDAVREETVSVNGGNVNDLRGDEFEGEEITGELSLVGHGEEAVIYDVIPTSISYEEGDPDSEEIRSPLPPNPNKHAGTIRIYKPELKSFARVPTSGESEESLGLEIRHQCSVCQKLFHRLENMERHLLLHTALRFRCDECDREFKNVHNLTLHKGKHQRLKEKEEKKAEPPLTSEVGLKCRNCPLIFSTKARRLCHERTHKEDKPHECDVCGLAFRSRSGLADHSIGHKGQRNHFCHICPAGFLRARNLLKHIRFVHSLVQIKTVLDGRRLVEFVRPEDAERLIEERKNNVERKDKAEDSGVKGRDLKGGKKERGRRRKVDSSGDEEVKGETVAKKREMKDSSSDIHNFDNKTDQGSL